MWKKCQYSSQQVVHEFTIHGYGFDVIGQEMVKLLHGRFQVSLQLFVAFRDKEGGGGRGGGGRGIRVGAFRRQVFDKISDERTKKRRNKIHALVDVLEKLARALTASP